MKKYTLFFLLITVTTLAQNELFKVRTIDVKMTSKGNAFYQSKDSSTFFYEDRSYIVTNECRGEFGGKLFFKDKRDGQINFCEATCPLIINKLNNNYYLTTSLSHMSGSYGFYEISNPKDLTLWINDTIHYPDWQLSLGVKPLFKGYGKVILLSFVYKRKIYHIVSDNDGTYIAEKENAEIKKVQSISEMQLYSFSNEVCTTKEKHYLALIQTKGKQGYLEVFDDNINIYLYEQ